MLEPDSIVQRVRSNLNGASVVDLLAVGFSRREADANSAGAMARQVLTRYRSAGELLNASAQELLELTGLESYEVLRSQALMELGRKAAQTGRGDIDVIESSKDVVDLFSYLRNEPQEHFCSVLLDSRNQIIRTITVHKGTINMSIVGPREVFRDAIREAAASVIVVHNHPSGDPEPSPEDVDITSKLVEIGKMLDMPVIDHVIIGNPRWVSFREKGLIKL